MNIASQTSGAPAVGSDEFIINRSGTDYKLTKNDIVASVEAALALEESDRISADDNLEIVKLDKAGGNMTGLLTLSGNPTSNLHAAPKQYVDSAVSTKLSLSGGTMTGSLILNADPTINLQASTKQYVDGVGETKWKNTTNLDCSANPNYPISTVGTTYRVSVAGKIGGISGKTVQIDDIIYCHTEDTVGGNEGLVGSKYLVIQTNLVQASQSVIGYSKISTDALIDGGTDDETIITPRGVKKVLNELVPHYNKTSSSSTSVGVPVNIQSTVYLLSGTGTGVVTVTLPLLSSFTNSTEFTLVFKDAANNAGTNNIIINTSGGDTIDGSSSFSISTNSGSTSIVTDGGTKWYTI